MGGVHAAHGPKVNAECGGMCTPPPRSAKVGGGASPPKVPAFPSALGGKAGAQVTLIGGVWDAGTRAGPGFVDAKSGQATGFGRSDETVTAEAKAGGLPRQPEVGAGQSEKVACFYIGEEADNGNPGGGVGIEEQATKFGCNADAGGCEVVGGGGIGIGGTAGNGAESKADGDYWRKILQAVMVQSDTGSVGAHLYPHGSELSALGGLGVQNGGEAVEGAKSRQTVGYAEGEVVHDAEVVCALEAIAAEVKAGGLPRPPEVAAGQPEGSREVEVSIMEHVTKVGCNADAGGCELAGGGRTRGRGATGEDAVDEAAGNEGNYSGIARKWADTDDTDEFDKLWLVDKVAEGCGSDAGASGCSYAQVVRKGKRRQTKVKRAQPKEIERSPVSTQMERKEIERLRIAEFQASILKLQD